MQTQSMMEKVLFLTTQINKNSYDVTSDPNKHLDYPWSYLFNGTKIYSEYK